MNKKILIIGGLGYIGNRLFSYLKEKNQFAKITSVDLEWFGNYNNPNNIKLDYRTLSKETLSDYHVVILLAGHSSVKMCENNASSTFENNIANFVSLSQKLNDQQFIYASSSSVYGSINLNIMDETCREYIANNYYDFSKYAIDTYMKLSNNTQYYGLRFGTVNGYSVNFRDDIMINAMFCSAKSKKEISIFNRNIRRPILGISDLCRAIYSIITRGQPKDAGVYNLASFNSTVESIGRAVSDRLNVPLKILNDTSGAYDFAISTKKFEQAFDFKFTETPQSIIDEIEEKNASMFYSNRNSPKEYAV